MLCEPWPVKGLPAASRGVTLLSNCHSWVSAPLRQFQAVIVARV